MDENRCLKHCPTASLPKVSIVTPSFMRAGFIRMCLESVATQDYPNIEHIVVDGGSDDSTPEILREYEQRCGIRWISEPDGGMYEAINKGLSMATGEIVAYLNTDDAYLPWTVRSAVDALGRSCADAVFGDLLVVHQESESTGMTAFVQFYDPFEMFRYTFVGTIGQPTVFWRREVTQKLGPFSSDYRLIADCEYWLRMASSGFAIQHIPEVLALQLEHGETLRETYADQLLAEFKQLGADYPWNGPRRNAARERVRASIAWRRRNASLMWLWATGRGNRWVRFIRFLRTSGVAFPTAFALLSPLPNAVRQPFHLPLIADQDLLSRLTAGVVGSHDPRAAPRREGANPTE